MGFFRHGVMVTNYIVTPSLRHAVTVTNERGDLLIGDVLSLVVIDNPFV